MRENNDECFARYEAQLNTSRYDRATEKAKHAIDRLRKKGE